VGTWRLGSRLRAERRGPPRRRPENRPVGSEAMRLAPREPTPRRTWRLGRGRGLTSPKPGDMGRTVLSRTLQIIVSFASYCAEGADAWTASPDKKRPPFSTGAKLPWFSRVARAFLAANGWGAVGAVDSLRGWLCGFSGPRTAPFSWTPQHGVMRSPGPPNCFPSTECVRCPSGRAQAWCCCQRWRSRRAHCPKRRSAYGRRESDVR